MYDVRQSLKSWVVALYSSLGEDELIIMQTRYAFAAPFGVSA
jgi:hypothetical protein